MLERRPNETSGTCAHTATELEGPPGRYTLKQGTTKFPPTEGNRRRADVALPGSPNALCEWGQRNFGLRGSLGRDEDDTQATLAHAKA